jgi:hypothetical protein
MSITYLPVIAADDFEAFRKLSGREFPQTYDEWCDLRSKWLDDYRGAIRNIRVDARKFAQYLAENTKANELKSLLEFAEAAANGKY